MEPNYSALSTKDHDWERVLYSDIEKNIPKDVTSPKGNVVTLAHFVDANLMCCNCISRLATGMFSLLNKTSIDS